MTRNPGGSGSVPEDWLAWLPEDKERLFKSTRNELDVSYIVLSVALNDAFAMCQQGKLATAREQAEMYADLFARLVSRLHGVLETLKEHAQSFGVVSAIGPLHAGLFRGERSRQLVRNHRILSRLALRERIRFFRHIESLQEISARLLQDTRAVAAEIGDGTTLAWQEKWKELEVFHDDLNTCLHETTIMLKSFLCVLPTEQFAPFGERLLSRSPQPTGVPPRRTGPFLAKMAQV